MKILVLNSGSSSIKCQYFIDQKSIASIMIERIGEEESHSEIKYESKKLIYDNQIQNHHDALGMIFEMLLNLNILSSIKELDAVGHRVVHGGDTFKKATLVTDKVLHTIHSLIPLAPLHNPANLEGIEILYNKYPQIPQIAVFDTAFHQTMPEYSYLYPLPYELSRELHIRRYGFHGTSHNYVAKEVATIMRKPLDSLNLITLHLGNGASATAIKGGESIDTSMGMTPLEGLMMGTRSGDIDAAIIPYLVNNGNMPIEHIDNILNKESGLKGICGTNDMREVLAKAKEQDTSAKLALDMYIYRIKKYIGSYTVVLGRVDGIVFTGGIGEHAVEVRELICKDLYDSIGVEINREKNKNSDIEIQSERSRIKLFIIPTNEELEIALQVAEVVQ